MDSSLTGPSRKHLRFRTLLAGLATLALVQCGEPSQPSADSGGWSSPELASGETKPILLSGSAIAFDLNNRDMTVGCDFFLGSAIVWTNGGATELPGLDPLQPSCAIAINESGQIVGESTLLSQERHATLWSPDGTAHDLGTFPGGTISSATGINESGQVVGWGTDPSGRTLPFVWTSASGLRNLGGLPGGGDAWAYGVNDHHDVVGQARDASFRSHAVMWPSGGPIVDLGTLSVFPQAELAASSINNSGVVVGTSYSTAIRAFRWTAADGMIDLGLSRADAFSAASGDINDAGVIVGSTFSAAFPDGSHNFGFRWTEANGMVMLSKWTAARAINDCGGFVGSVPSYGSDAVLWPKKCEP